MRFIKKRDRGLLASILLIIVFFTLFFVYSKDDQPFHLNNDIQKADSVVVDRLIQEGNSLQHSIPDSATSCYMKAISILNQADSSFTVQTLLANCYIRLASVNNYTGNYKLSAHYDSLAMNIGLCLGDKNIQGQCLNVRGLLFFNQSNYPYALVCYKKALEYAVASGNKHLEAMVYTQFDIADTFFDKTVKLAVEIQDSLLISGSYINRGMIAQYSGDNFAALTYYTKASEMCARVRDKNGVILCKQNIGSLLFNNGQTIAALDAFTESLQLALKQNDLPNMAKGYHNMGEIYASISDYETAIDYYLRAAQLKERLNDLKGLASTYTSIGNLNYQRDNLKEALNDYRESLKINRKLDYQIGIAKDYSNFANIYREEGQWEKGLDFAFKSLRIHNQAHYEEGLGELYLIIGSLYSGQKDYETAEDYLRKALQKATETNDTLQLATIENEFVGIMLKRAECVTNVTEGKQICKKAAERAESVLKLINDKQAFIIRYETLGLLEEAYLKCGELSKALWASHESRQLSDSLLNSEKSKYLILAEIKWKANQNKAKVAELEKQQRQKDLIIQQKEKENKQQHWIIYLLVVVGILLLAGILFFVMYVRKKRKELYYRQLHQVTELRMKSIRNRISSHFFFNILNAISIYEPERMKQILGKLILLLRKSVENIDQLSVTVREELELVKAFVDLQQLRLSDQFTFQISIDKQVNQEQLLPAMIIQIPVENAIKHGLYPLEGSQKLQIRIEQLDRRLLIRVIDNGVGFEKSGSWSKGTGTGLKVLYEVISLLNSKNENKISFEIRELFQETEGCAGTTVQISIPQNYQFNN
jgi:tetratricopeptide (TPR) repeat protein